MFNSPWTVIFIMSLFFVNCERTNLFPVKRDLDPAFTALCFRQTAPLQESRVAFREGPQKNGERANLALSFYKAAPNAGSTQTKYCNSLPKAQNCGRYGRQLTNN